MRAVSQQGDAREVFKPADVADVDQDGFPEFIDAWGKPIRFLRWAPGFLSDLQQVWRGTIDATTMNVMAGPPFTLQVTQPMSVGFSNDAGRYLFGAIGVLDPTSGTINPQRTARITGYNYNENGTPTNRLDDIVTITCAPVNGVQPFNPGTMAMPPAAGDQIVIMAPDPFDSRGVYPLPQASSGTYNTQLAPFALYPLIYSAGPNRCYGIQTDLLGTPPGFTMPQPIRYAQNFCGPLSPFVWNMDGMAGSGLLLVGQSGDFPAEANYVRSGWLDNIHNHDLGSK